MLKPNTNFTFSKADLEFVLELCKVGHVNLLSSQVSMICPKDSSSTPSLSFKDYGGTDGKKCAGLQLPPNWFIEGIYTSDRGLSVLFAVEKLPG